MDDLHEGGDLPKDGKHDRPADGEPPDWIDRFAGERVDVAYVKGIDEGWHTLNCPCGCEGEATVIKESGVDGAYVASTVDAVQYLKDRGESP